MAIEDHYALINMAVCALKTYSNYVSQTEWKEDAHRHETLLTPARYGYGMWGAVHFLMASVTVTDYFAPSLSVIESAENPNNVRLTLCMFLLSMCQVGSFVQIKNLKFPTTLGVWMLLLSIYELIQTKPGAFDANRYFCSELGIVVGFAWTSVTLMVSVALYLQTKFGTRQSLVAHVALLTVLCAGTMFVVVKYSDWAFAAVVVWSLVAISRQPAEWEKNEAVKRVHGSVQSCAKAYAALISALVVASIAMKLL